MNMGPGTNDLYNQSMGLYNQQQQQQQRQDADQAALGEILALLSGGGGR